MRQVYRDVGNPALTTALLTSFTPIINKRILADADVPVVAWAAQAVSLPLLGLATIVLFRPLPQVDALFYVGVLGSAVLNAVAHLALTAALKLTTHRWSHPSWLSAPFSH